MRYAVMADIHSNLEAFRAVLGALARERIDSYLFVGDIVGYGPDPKECIRLLREMSPSGLAAGNHDRAAARLLSPDYFNEYAKEAIAWTMLALDDRETEYLKSMGLVYKEKAFTLVHGSLDHPEDFNYILGPEDASKTIENMDTAVCFVGHSHVPEVFTCENDEVLMARSSRVEIEPGVKYVVNVGSVGQPRDMDTRASFAIYDEEASVVELIRVGYDMGPTQIKMIKAGLPRWLAERLSGGV